MTVYGIKEVGDGWFACTYVYAEKEISAFEALGEWMCPNGCANPRVFRWRAASETGYKAGPGEETITRGASIYCTNTAIHREWKGMITGFAPTDNGEYTYRNWLDRWGCEV